MFRKKSIQKIKAKAVWNKEKHVWEVIVKQKITARNLYDKYFTTKTKSKITSIKINSTQTSKTPILMPAFKGTLRQFRGLERSARNEVLAFARVFILIPNQATK